MADGTQLGDILAGAGGVTVNRPALNAAVMQGQAMAGLRTAQTDEALAQAAIARDEMAARGQIRDHLVATGMDPHQADVMTDAMRAKFGTYQQVAEGMKVQQDTNNRAILSDPTKIGSPEQTAAMQGVQGKIEPFATVPSAYVTTPGSNPNPDVRVSPVAGAKMSLEDSQALLARMHAEHPEAFLANGALTPEGVSVLTEYLRENPDVKPNSRNMSARTAQIVAPLLENQPGAAPPVTSKPGVPGGGTAVPGATPAANANPDASPAVHVDGGHIKPAPGVSLAEQAAIRKDFASGKASQQMSSLNTMVLHSMLFDKVADQVGAGNFTPTNEINLLWQRVFGRSAPTDLKLVGSFLGREAVRATVNAGAGTGEERELAIPANASPQTFHDAADTLRSLAGSQLHSLIRRGARGGVDATQLLDQEAIDAYGMGHSGVNTGSGPTGGNPTVPHGTAPGTRPPLGSFQVH